MMDVYIEFGGRRIRCIDKKEIFDEADKWLKRNKPVLEREYAGRYVLVNALNQAGVAEQDFDKASLRYQETYGPTPPEGRNFLGKQF